MFGGRYDNWNGRDVNEVFKNLGAEKANEIYEQKITEGMSDYDAWMEVYSMECQMNEDEEIPLIDTEFVNSGGLFDMMNDLADVADRNAKRKAF